MNHWLIIREAAKKARAENTEWESLPQRKKYGILEVEEDYIIIKKLSGGKDVLLSRKTAENAINILQVKKRVHRDKLLGSVARERALIFLHSSIYWDDASNEIVWKED